MMTDDRLGAPCHTTEGWSGYRHSNPSKPMRTWGERTCRDLFAYNADDLLGVLVESVKEDHYAF